MKLFQVLIVAVFTLFEIFEVLADRPCATRQIPDQSTVCVCNTSYCDEITREVPSSGFYIAYTTSKAGLRFNKTQGKWSDEDISSCCPTILEIDTKTTYQKVQGFGGAVTDAAAINWRSLPPILQDSLIKSYFSEKGLEYNMLRVPIGGCDFSTHPYAYNELPVNDTYLTNYTLAPEDVKFKIPMIKSIMEVAKSPIHIVATTWSPPVWMKTGNTYGGLNRLKPEYFQTYADYHLKFIQKYNESGIPIWGITTTNEPIDGVFALATFNSLGWDMIEMGKWIVDNLGPTIRNSDFKDVKIITGDDQRITIPYWFNVMLSRHPNALQYIDGIGVHYYTDKFIPPAIFEIVTLTHPEKFILATEACEGSFPWQSEKVLPGSWDRAKSYILDILEDLNYNLVGWIDWNLCLNNKGGPNWVGNYVDSAIIVDEKRNEFFKQPMFYAMGHFSKFIPRDSVRIKVTEKKSFLSSYLHQVAFITSRNTIVIIIYNNGHERTVILSNGNKQTSVFLEADSVTTVEFLNK